MTAVLNTYFFSFTPVGVCIDESKVCDGKVDCPYLSKAFYNSQCLDKNDGCETKISNDEQNNDFVCSEYPPSNDDDSCNLT